MQSNAWLLDSGVGFLQNAKVSMHSPHFLGSKLEAIFLKAMSVAGTV